MRIQNISNQKFNGYSNVIFHDSGEGEQRCLFVAAKLDNKDGFNDLEEYRAFKKMYDMSPAKIDDETILMFYNKLSPNEDCLFLGDEPLFWGYELKSFQKRNSADEYKCVEEPHMKAYTLMCSLTRRIIDSTNQLSYDALNAVEDTCRKVFFAISSDFNASRSLVDSAVNDTFGKPNGAMKSAAKEINKIIDKTMQGFF